MTYTYKKNNPHPLNSNWSHSSISYICRDCGIFGNLVTCTHRYFAAPIEKEGGGGVHTVHTAKACQYCQRKGIGVSHVRDYFFPDFSLIRKKLRREYFAHIGAGNPYKD